MIKANNQKGKSHVLANIKSETIIDDKRETTEKANNEITIIPLPILQLTNDHTFVQSSLFEYSLEGAKYSKFPFFSSFNEVNEMANRYALCGINFPMSQLRERQ